MYQKWTTDILSDCPSGYITQIKVYTRCGLWSFHMSWFLVCSVNFRGYCTSRGTMRGRSWHAFLSLRSLAAISLFKLRLPLAQGFYVTFCSSLSQVYGSRRTAFLSIASGQNWSLRYPVTLSVAFSPSAVFHSPWHAVCNLDSYLCSYLFPACLV